MINSTPQYGLYNTEPVIRTFTGKYVNVFDPKPEMFCIEDIAHALSHQCRFGGHLPQFYSVAHHSILCAKHIEAPHKLVALMHDASEAYLVDIPRPIKKKLHEYGFIEDRLMQFLAGHFGFKYPLAPEVKEVDEFMLKIEWNELMMEQHPRVVIEEIHSPIYYKNLFIKTYNDLKNETR